MPVPHDLLRDIFGDDDDDDLTDLEEEEGSPSISPVPPAHSSASDKRGDNEHKDHQSRPFPPSQGYNQASDQQCRQSAFTWQDTPISTIRSAAGVVDSPKQLSQEQRAASNNSRLPGKRYSPVKLSKAQACFIVTFFISIVVLLVKYRKSGAVAYLHFESVFSPGLTEVPPTNTPPGASRLPPSSPVYVKIMGARFKISKEQAAGLIKMLRWTNPIRRFISRRR